MNADYTLTRVHVEPAKFVLRYEFLSSKKIASLNVDLLRRSGQTAYCRASKLELFRQKGMPARWTYTDRDGDKFEFLTKPNDC